MIMGRHRTIHGLVDRRTVGEVSALRERNERLLAVQLGVPGLVVRLGVEAFPVVVRMALRPLARLTRAARQIAGGDYRQRADVRAVAELERLADDFNATALAVEGDVLHREQARRAAERAEILATLGAPDPRAAVLLVAAAGNA